LYDKITPNSLVFTGAYIPTCSTPSSSCLETNFDFSNAFVGDIGYFNFDSYGLSARKLIGLEKI
jgi:hypothetical protein